MRLSDHELAALIDALPTGHSLVDQLRSEQESRQKADLETKEKFSKLTDNELDFIHRAVTKGVYSMPGASIKFEAYRELERRRDR